MTRRLTVLLSAGVFSPPCLPLSAANGASPSPTVNRPVSFAVSAPLREIAKLPSPTQWGFHNTETQARIPKPLRSIGRVVDPVEQSAALPASNYSLGTSFLGLGHGFPNSIITGAPPDTNIAVGDTQIVEWVNVQFAVFDKSRHSAGRADEWQPAMVKPGRRVRQQQRQ